MISMPYKQVSDRKNHNREARRKERSELKKLRALYTKLKLLLQVEVSIDEIKQAVNEA